MAEKVAKLGIRREKDMMYFIKDGAVWKVPRKQPGQAKGKEEKVADGNFVQDDNFIHFLDEDGDVARAARAVGGQTRGRGSAPALAEAQDECEEPGGDAVAASERRWTVMYETVLQQHVVDNLDQIEPGLTLYGDDQGRNGVEFDTGAVGRIDVLAVNEKGEFVVIELKAGEASDGVVGQVLRYTNWVKHHLAGSKRVRAYVIAGSIPVGVRYAVDLQQYEHDDTADADLVGPDDPARARRLAWASLFRRVWREDVLVCSRCGGEPRLVAVIEAPAVIEKILRHIGRWKRGPPAGRRVVVESRDHESLYDAD